MTSAASRARVLLLLVTLGAAAAVFGWKLLDGGSPRKTVVVVVMDPLAKQLACPCVAGYAQRDYEPLGAFLSRRLDRRVRVVYAEALDKALRNVRRDCVALIIGKQSVVKADAREAGLSTHPLGWLTGQDGGTTITGLFIVRSNDPARTLADLKGRRILFGSVDADEKHSAALAAWRAAGLMPPVTIETREGCSEAAVEVQDSTNTPLPAAVISSYALPLLEGCGNVQKGALRVIGKTGPVPFVTAFAAGELGAALESQLGEALLAVRADAALLKAIESKNGFVALPAATSEWAGWRGAQRDGRAGWLPAKLPDTLRVAWRKPLHAPALAGVAAAEGVVVVADRDPLDQHDVFVCLRAEDGEPIWRLEYPAPGELDYGLSPRATPVIRDGKVYLLGALGALHCVELSQGKTVWQKSLAADFKGTPPKWGWCAAPLIVDEKLIVNPGAPAAALVALNRFTGDVIWQTRGAPAAYASFICGRFGSRRQIVGYDARSLGGWDPQTGRRLWTLVPPHTGDFNVTTPVEVNGRLLVATENNGTRLYQFREEGTIVAQPLAENPDLAPDASTPVVAAGQVIGCASGLQALDLAAGLKKVWTLSDDAFHDFSSLITADDRVLAATFHGELWLLAPKPDRVEIISKLRVLDDEAEMYSHPALAGRRLFLRDRAAICCVPLDAAEPSAGTMTSTAAP